jgi:hypothetical protein
MNSETIAEEMYRHYLIRRAEGHGEAAAPSASASASASATSGHDAAATSVTVTKKKQPLALANPEILQTGTLFYVATAVTTLLWVTGKAIDIKTERQERYAESLVNSI